MKKILFITSLLVMASMLLAACGTPTPINLNPDNGLTTKYVATVAPNEPVEITLAGHDSNITGKTACESNLYFGTSSTTSLWSKSWDAEQDNIGWGFIYWPGDLTPSETGKVVFKQDLAGEYFYITTCGSYTDTLAILVTGDSASDNNNPGDENGNNGNGATTSSIFMACAKETKPGSKNEVRMVWKAYPSFFDGARGFEPDIAHLLVEKVNPSETELASVVDDASKLATALGVNSTWEGPNDACQIAYDAETDAYWVVSRTDGDEMSPFWATSGIDWSQKLTYHDDSGHGIWSSSVEGTTSKLLGPFTYAEVKAFDSDLGFQRLLSTLRAAIDKDPMIEEGHDYEVVTVLLRDTSSKETQVFPFASK